MSKLSAIFIKGGVLFKGNLRGQAAKSYEKITNRMEVGLTAVEC